MKKSKVTEEQITYALRQVESGTPPADVCRQVGRQRSDLLHLEEKMRTWVSASCGSGPSLTHLRFVEAYNASAVS